MGATPPIDTVGTSRFLAFVLRHHPEAVGITLDARGWADVDALLSALARHDRPLSRKQLEDLVRSSDKQRFALDSEGRRIRANQGHSVDVDLGLPPATPPDRLFHGTSTRNADAILRSGLERRDRHAVHLSADVETAHRVGGRRGPHVVLEVDAAAMHRDGHTFTVADNGVWLTDQVPARYLVLTREPRG